MADNDGFLKLSRGITTHWIWQDAERLKWWLDILFSVNFKDGAGVIHGEKIECKRGQSLYSLDTWAQRWRVDKSKVRRFLELLENEHMIVTEGLRKTTRLTVCNYATYNDWQHTNDTQTTHKRHSNDTLTTPREEGEESKEGNKGIKKDWVFENPFSENFLSAWAEWKTYKKQTFKFSYKTKESENAAAKKLYSLSGANEQQAEKLIQHAIANQWQGFYEIKNFIPHATGQQPANNDKNRGANQLLAIIKGRGLSQDSGGNGSGNAANTGR